MAVDIATLLFVRPSGAIPVRWIGAIGDTGQIYIRYWIMDPATARNTPVQTIANYCRAHHICFLTSENLHGCPECWERFQHEYNVNSPA